MEIHLIIIIVKSLRKRTYVNIIPNWNGLFVSYSLFCFLQLLFLIWKYLL